MKLLVSAAVLGVASAAIQSQQVPLQDTPSKFAQQASDSVASKSLGQLIDALGGIVSEAQEIWDEVAALFPEAMEKANFLSEPKPHVRKHDSEWDYIMKGVDVQNVWIENSKGEKELDVDGKLENYNLRTKEVDPSGLGVDKVKQYSGYIDNEEEDKHLFYWFFESRNDPKNDPVILWLNGGPGCSSLMGLFMELGPSYVNKKIGLDFNPASWNSNASVLFLDQPVNVGYSYSGSSVSDTIVASKDVYAFLTLFFKQFPEYADQDFHIAGESYSGHYIPVFASDIMSHKKTNINLKSIMIGNGLTDGLTQYEYYRPMACGDGGWPAVLDESECQAMDNALPRCQKLIESCYESKSLWSCVPASLYCNNALIGPYQRTGQNVYDVRSKCEDSGSFCYKEIGWITEFLNDKKIMDAVGAEVSSFENCNVDINRKFLFHGDWFQPFHRLVPKVLEKMPVLIYAGDADYICNWLGNQAWMEALEWPGQKAYNKAKTEDLLFNGKTKTGSVKSSGNFTFIRLHAGGHMLPHDQPLPSLDMVNRWMGGEWLE